MPTTDSPLLGTFATSVTRLTDVPAGQRRAFLDLPPTPQGHADAFSQVTAFREVETGGATTAPPAGRKLRAAAWNLERCLYPDVAARVLHEHGIHLALLTEMDWGMLRTGQEHTTRRIAERMGQQYAYGLEFLELMPMPPPPGFPVIGDGNNLGFHGNGIVGAVAWERPAVIRLDEVADWYAAPKGGQRRVGSRMAVVTTIMAEDTRFVACSVHLESATDGEGRATQMRTLLDALDAYAGGLPVLIGGDLNSHVQPGGHTDPAEPLFALAKQRGYDFAACNLVRPTTRTSFWSESEGTRQLDWFCTRSLRASAPEIIPSLGPDGTVLTDHELILLTIG